MKRAWVLLLLAGCPSSKGPAAAIEPTAPKVGDADPAMKPPAIAACTEPARHDLMVVDWTPELRGDLEVAMKEGVALVAYDCTSLRLVPACTLEGSYGYLGTTRREKKIEMTSKDEIAANLPVGGLSWLSDLGGKLSRGSALMARLVMVGKRSSARKVAAKSDLQGSCTEATHFVRAATIGAFVVATGSQAELAASVKIVGKGAAGSSTSATKVQSEDGDVEACMKSTSEDKKPPEQCGALVRIELEPLGDAPARPELAVTACPAGFARTDDGACRKPTLPHQCKPGDGDACAAQCEAGHAGSCATLAAMHRGGIGVAKDFAKAATLAQKACAADVMQGCRIAAAAKLGGEGIDKDAAGALALLERACQAGDGMGCVELGIAQLADKKAAANAQYAFRRACYGGGEHEGCAWLGTLYAEGKGGMRVSPKLAAPFFEKGCKEGSARACTGLADLLKTGKGIAKNAARATELYTRACNAGHEPACKKR